MTPLKSFLVGKGEDCDLRVTDDQYVSKKHARIYNDEDGQVWVEDMGSTNGTFVNRMRVISPTRMFPGDVLKVGRTIIPWLTS